LATKKRRRTIIEGEEGKGAREGTYPEKKRYSDHTRRKKGAGRSSRKRREWGERLSRK